MEHPDITRTLQTGYPIQDEREQAVSDFPIEDHFGSEIREGDKYFEDGAGRVVLESNADDYLIEVIGVKYRDAVEGK